MKIKLDNTDRDGTCLVTTWDCEKGEPAEAGAGYIRWEQGPDGVADGFAYALLDDHPGLPAELREAGYEVCEDDYTPPEGS